MRLHVDYDPFIFYEVEGSFFYPIVPTQAGLVLTHLKAVPVRGMFQLHEVHAVNKKVGYSFSSPFATRNGGGYLVTFLKNKGKAEEHEVVLRLDDLVIFNYPNRGTLAASPKVGATFARILESQ